MSAIYQLPSDIWGLLIEYIPLYMYAVCKQIPFISNIHVVNEHLYAYTTIYPDSILHDVIRRNEVKFCKQYLSTTSIDFPCSSLSSRYLIEYGIISDYWFEAVKYGRIEILDIFYKITIRAESPLVDPSNHKWYNPNMVICSRNAETFRWFLTTYHGRNISRAWIYDLVSSAIDREDISALNWLVSHVPITNNQPPATDESYFDYADKNTSANEDPISYLIRRTPTVLAWYQGIKVARIHNP
jgi:hypothetical protein